MCGCEKAKEEEALWLLLWLGLAADRLVLSLPVLHLTILRTIVDFLADGAEAELSAALRFLAERADDLGSLCIHHLEVARMDVVCVEVLLGLLIGFAFLEPLQAECESI
jgi:hypothetical protein